MERNIGLIASFTMGPIWGQQDQGGTHVGPMSFAFVGAMRCHEMIIMQDIPHPTVVKIIFKRYIYTLIPVV